MSVSKFTLEGFSNAGQQVPGMSQSTGTIPDITAFGDSGDTFDHVPWRSLFMLLGQSNQCSKQLTALSTQFLLRGRQTKMENKSKSVAYTISLDNETKSRLAKAFKDDKSTATDIFKFHVLFATGETRVPSQALTPERLKCILRPIVVPSMMSAERMPATSCAIGFDNLAKDMKKFNIANGNITGISGATEDQKKKFLDEAGISKEVYEMWLSLRMVLSNFQRAGWLSLTAAYSASMTQKEIYEECEKLFPGTIFFSGIHCIMTDVSNKKKANEVTKDLRYRFENSNFYGDFKRKQIARMINTVSSEAYIKGLESSINIMGRYLKSSTGVSESEITVIDSVMKKVQESRIAEFVKLEDTDGIETDSAEDVLRTLGSMITGELEEDESK